ncbi:MAG: hypothetical protein C3F15_03045 [Holophagae bacterium]|nr:MAG: hypothetical protein C3F15_03045 [Holophagae bacterium]
MSQGRHVLDDYRLEKVVRSTPHTTVFRALDPATSRRVVIKLIYPPSATVPETSRTAFLEAAELARSSSARGMPRVVDYGFTPDDQAFLVMGMVELAVPVSGLPGSSVRRRVGIARRVVEAVDSLAASGGTHLNLRPDNLLVAADESVLLTGYGTAAYRAGVAEGSWPEAGDRWVAPELARPRAWPSADLGLADLYSLALVVCDLLGAAVEELGGDAPAVHVPEAAVLDRLGLEGVLAAALRRDPAARAGTLADLQRLLVAPEPAASGAPAGMADLDPAGFETRAITQPLELPPPAALPEPVAPAPPVRQLAPAPVAVADEPAPPPAEVRPQPVPETPVAPPAAAPPAVARRQRRLPPWVLAAPAAGLVLVGVAGWLVTGLGRSGGQGVAAVPTPLTAPRPAPTRPAAEPAVHPILLEAEQLMNEGNLPAVRALLEGLAEEVVNEFNGPETELYQELMASVGEADREQALRDLEGGLDSGSITMLRRAVSGLSGLSGDELAADRELAGKLDRAQRALAASQQLRDAEREGDPLLVVERAGAMIAVLPGHSRTYTLRDQAAATVEEQAESAIAARDLAAALAMLRELERRWPDRPGLAERIRWCEQEERRDAELESVLARAAAAGERGAPEEGLQLLASTVPNEAFTLRFAARRDQLQGQLEAMDAGAPVITIPEGFEAVIRKNETTVVPIEARDDYRVERVTAWIRSEQATEFQEIALASEDGSLYRLQVTPELHGNDRVLFYVIAVDRSGHTTRLGSAEQPLVLDRRGWLKRLTGGGG